MYIRIARDATALSARLSDGPFDLLVYEFFPEEDAALAFPTCDWRALDGAERSDIALGYLRSWPSVPEMLTELARRARDRAKVAASQRRLTERASRNRKITHFIRHLANYFRQELGGPLEGTIAHMASVMFEKSIDRQVVKRALRHNKKGGA